MLKKILIATAFLPLVTLGACATTATNGYVAAKPSDVPAIAAGTPNQSASAQVAYVQNPLVGNGRMSPEAFRTAQSLAVSCQQQIRPQVASAASTTAQGAVFNGILGGGGTAAGSQVFAGTSALAYFGYAAPGYAAVGGYQGAVTGSYSNDGAIATCTRDFTDDLRGTTGYGFLNGFHVEVVTAGKSGDPTPPAMAPNWNGWGPGMQGVDPRTPATAPQSSNAAPAATATVRPQGTVSSQPLASAARPLAAPQ